MTKTDNELIIHRVTEEDVEALIANRCYERCGFSVFGLQPLAICVDGRYYDELLMAQAL